MPQKRLPTEFSDVVRCSIRFVVLVVLALVNGTLAEDEVKPPANAVPEKTPGVGNKIAGRITFGKGESLAEFNKLFEQTDGWIGGDGAYSVALTKDRTLWLFSDTWIGQVRDGKRTGATMVNNSAAWQDGRGKDAKVRFFVQVPPDKNTKPATENAKPKPVALLVPDEEQSWFWLQAGALDKDRLSLVVSRIEKTKEPGAFGFREIDRELATITNPQEEPTKWRATRKKIPFAIYEADRQLAFGAAILADGEYYYVYGTDETRKKPFPERSAIVARVIKEKITDFSSWRFYHGGQWDEDWKHSDHLAKGLATEYSVSSLPGIQPSTEKQFLLVYTENGLSDKIVLRTATAPQGPWSDSQVVFQCPEMVRDKKVFSYAAKSHPMLSSDGELIVSYVVNSFDFWQVFKDAQLYWPRFVRVPITIGTPHDDKH